MECLETRRLFAFAQGELDAEAAHQVEQHLDSCASCRALVGEAARTEDGEAGSSTPSPSSSVPPLSWLERGALLGRYVVLERIGAGGMGVVHAAYDPELDRRVALKLIRIDSTTPAHLERAQARLLREAQATARVIHPNVITIHDVGRFGEHVFLAMELVDGTTLRSHIRAHKGRNDWRETLSLFIQAGRGLAAAHAQGLVHRDFKPDNVLVGKDGRVRITDFGLARIVEGIDDTPTPPGSSSPVPLRSEWHTRSDMVLGTPAYMAPEQKRGEPSDARSDQYSFCVALHEALYGKRPFATPAAVVNATPEAPLPEPVPRPPQGSDVPAWVHQVILQGLSASPDARHDSMEALLRRLGHAPGEKWRRAVLAASAGLLLLAGGAALHRSTSGDPCAGSEQSLIGIWDASRKATVQTVFKSSPLPYAAGAWTEVERTLDGFARNWVAASHEACVATRVKGQQTERLLERRVICLDQRLKDLGAVVDTLATADTQVIQNSPRMAHGLENLSVCANLSALAAPEPPPTDESSQKHMEAVRAQRAQVRAKLTAGQLAPALALATEVAREAHEIGYGPLEAEVLDLVAESQGKNLAYRDAIKTLHHAIQVATASRHDRQAAESWAGMIRLISLVGPEVDPDGVAPAHAEAALKRLGEDARIEAMYFRNLASLHRTRGRPAEALAASEKAVELARKVYTANEPELGTALLTMSHALHEFNRHAEGLRYLLEAEAIYRKTYGPNHPYLATVLGNLSVFSIRVGDSESALKYARESLAIHQGAYGEESEPAASVLHNIGGFLLELGRTEESIQHYQRAIRIREKVMGPEHPEVASSLSRLGTALASLGHFEEALKHHQRALLINEKSLGPQHSMVALDLLGIGDDYQGLGAPKKAIPFLERSVTVYEKQTSTKNDDFLADGRFSLARALMSTSNGLERARQLATAAQEYNHRFPKPRARQVKEVEQWLAAHRAPGPRQAPSEAETREPGPHYPPAHGQPL
ncbi:tetratricopeptide repeat protein [Myxococcus sp. CA040A]|uniref:tetratricopeptide repeat protein n=1 Tax=Myxococcus sp. CA040A TaxID=2741738 RepID=UPI00157AD547|nr:tetratricopeptide repeat protein [Myxococcus sp. CA040A]NTX03804.1 tetratricopeptide repeat protein [Myxococcus sp. CA040A]